MSNTDPNKGNNCGNYKRGSKPMTEPKCVVCGNVENETKVKFSQWEAKE